MNPNEREYRALLARMVDMQVLTERRVSDLWTLAQGQAQTIRTLEEGIRLDRQELARVKAERQEGSTALLSILTGPKMLPLLTAIIGALASAALAHFGALHAP